MGGANGRTADLTRVRSTPPTCKRTPHCKDSKHGGRVRRHVIFRPGGDSFVSPSNDEWSSHLADSSGARPRRPKYFLAMDPSIMKLLEEDEVRLLLLLLVLIFRFLFFGSWNHLLGSQFDESMHSGADVEALSAELNRDIGGEPAAIVQPPESDAGEAIVFISVTLFFMPSWPA
ncbi:hypothetical protein BHE74_00027752 [Ensete ventricosum]|nr:hypothetical protein BHE74_00027752 [Ensete ventricosum]